MKGVLVLLATVLASACMSPGPAPDYRAFEQWDIASLVIGGRPVDVSRFSVREFQPPAGGERMRLAIKGCETLRFVWQLVHQEDKEAGLRTVEAVSTRGDCDEVGDTDLRAHLRRVNRVRFEVERIELLSPSGRLVLQPS